jgi:hypothetical protein
LPVAARRDLPDIATAHMHGILRLACGVTTSFVAAETFGWHPTFLAAILTATLLASLPSALSIKAGITLVLVQTGGAFAAFSISLLLIDTPFVLFGIIALIIFMSFATIARGRGFLPVLLLLICFATIPIVTMVSPQQAELLPVAFARAMAIAVAIVWLMHALWPKLVAKERAAAKANLADPLPMALAGTVIVLPLMLLYLMFGLTDALPVLITTVVLVLNFDRQRGAAQGLAMMIGNFFGGMIALLCYALLQIAPSLTALTSITLIMALLFAQRMEHGGPGAAVSLITLNQAIIMFSLSLMPGSSSPGIWASRLLQFATACAFAIGMMVLLLPRRNRAFP